jgi:hypothetical protein
MPTARRMPFAYTWCPSATFTVTIRYTRECTWTVLQIPQIRCLLTHLHIRKAKVIVSVITSSTAHTHTHTHTVYPVSSELFDVTSRRLHMTTVRSCSAKQTLLCSCTFASAFRTINLQILQRWRRQGWSDRVNMSTDHRTAHTDGQFLFS